MRMSEVCLLIYSLVLTRSITASGEEIEGDRQLSSKKSNSTRTTSTRYGRIHQNFYFDTLTYHQHPLHWSYPEVLLLLGFVPEISSLFPVPLWWLYHLHPCQTARTLLWILQARDKWQTLNVKRHCSMCKALLSLHMSKYTTLLWFFWYSLSRWFCITDPDQGHLNGTHPWVPKPLQGHKL